MNYIFGNKQYNGNVVEIVKTEDNKYSNLSGFITYTYSTPSINITHSFRIVRKYREEVDKNGVYCTWYMIDNHTKDIDRTPGIVQDIATQVSRIDDNSAAIDDIIISILGG